VPYNFEVVADSINGYDKAGNRTHEQVTTPPSTLTVQKATFNGLNQLASIEGGGPVAFEGDVSEPARVNVGGTSATVSSNNVFTASVTLGAGTNTVEIAATDYSGNNNTITNTYQVIVGSAGGQKTLTYDLNGNLSSVISDLSSVIYSWDAADRLVKIVKGSDVTEFVYDGLGRRVKIIQGGVTNSFLWCGAELCEKRDATGATTLTRYFPQGEQQGTDNLFYFRNHLGSVTEMTDSSGAIRARYNYDDPYGRTVKVSGDLDAAFRFQGMYYFNDDLYLTLFRGYQPSTATWLSRDLIGRNDYIGLGNDPINYVDPLGLYVEWVENASEEWYQEAGKAYREAYSTDAGKKLLQILEQSPERVLLQPDWNPNDKRAGVVLGTKKSGCLNLEFQPTRLTLVHEAQHAAEELRGQLDPANLGVVVNPFDSQMESVHGSKAPSEWRASRAANIMDREFFYSLPRVQELGLPHQPYRYGGLPVPSPYGVK